MAELSHRRKSKAVKLNEPFQNSELIHSPMQLEDYNYGGLYNPDNENNFNRFQSGTCPRVNPFLDIPNFS